MKYFVTAIGTDSGKTVFSAILTEALKADYWKPIQAGYPTDSDTVRHLLSNDESEVIPEYAILNMPASPHAAAEAENRYLKSDNILLPETDKPLVVEGAGGILVPINQDEFVIDIAQRLRLEVILVSNLYLGNINHTLLSIQELKARNIVLKGIVFNGEPNEASQQIILKYAQVPQLLHIYPEKEITKETIKQYAELLKKEIK